MSGSAVVRGVNDPAHVERQYETEAGLEVRAAAYRHGDGPDARDVVFRSAVTRAPRSVLECGCGQGELAARMAAEPGVSVVAIDRSPRMVELTRGRGVDARVADVQELPFPDGAFDVVVAAWMLYHVPDVDRGLSEIARVLRPGGWLVAATNHADHLAELLALADVSEWELAFSGENGAALLGRHFDSVRWRDVDGTVVFADIDAVRSYYASSDRLAVFAARLPEVLPEPLVARRRTVVYVAERAATSSS